jgi:hypothetical protein
MARVYVTKAGHKEIAGLGGGGREMIYRVLEAEAHTRGTAGKSTEEDFEAR